MSAREAPIDATVFIAELEDLDDLDMLTGRFSAHVEGNGGPGDEVDDISADEAIAWGRERASVVLIRTGDSDYYSAGVENPDDLPEWPPPDLRLERRRVREFEALDNSEDDPPVLWDVRVSAEGPRRIRTKPFRDAVRDHPATRDVKAPAPGYPRASASFLVEASTVDQARAIADKVFQTALEALGKARLNGWRESGLLGGFEVYPHRPGKQVEGPGIRH